MDIDVDIDEVTDIDTFVSTNWGSLEGVGVLVWLVWSSIGSEYLRITGIIAQLMIGAAYVRPA